MSPENLAPLLEEAVASLKAAEVEAAAMREALPGLILERQDWERGQRRLIRLITVLVVMLAVVLVYLLPLAQRNSESLHKVTKTLDIVERVTGPDATKRSQTNVAVLLCGLTKSFSEAVGAEPPSSLEMVVDDKVVAVPCLREAEDSP